MLTIIAFIITLVGATNWLTIGLLQYDFIAGVFGYQASVFSRIIYIIFGLACAFLVFKLFKGKGTLAVFSRRNKRDLSKNLQKMGHNKEEKAQIEARYAQSNVEGAENFVRHSYEDYSPNPRSRNIYEEDFREPRNLRNESKPPQSMFDEHFDERGE